ncbi:MAG: hypothetical protein JWP91_2052 [Fibrobacteres bacterium]|nr:hypothetical protein [Fibrobacterota bacterium]
MIQCGKSGDAETGRTALRGNSGRAGMGKALASWMGLAGMGVAAMCGCRMTTEAVDWAPPQRILFQDGFSGNGYNWFTGTVPDRYDFEIVDGEYFLRSLNDSGIIVSKEMAVPESEDFIVSASFHSYRSEKDQGYGLCWGGGGGSDTPPGGGTAPGDRFCFFISRDRRYTLFKREGGSVSEYIPWTATSALREDRNVLELRKRGESILIVINGGDAGVIPYERFHGDRLCFAGDGIQDFAVDEIAISVR